MFVSFVCFFGFTDVRIETEYTDDQIIASIKKQLNDRLQRQEQSKQSTQEPSTTEFHFDLFSSTDEIDPHTESTEMNDSADSNAYIHQNVIAGAEQQEFTDDFPAITDTIRYLDEALLSLNNAEVDNNEDYDELLEAIKERIKSLLTDYYVVERKTMELISLIQKSADKNDRRKLTTFNFNQYSNENNEYDENVFNVILERFGDDIEAMKRTMLRLVENLNDLKQYSNEEETELEDKITDVLDKYFDIIEDTNELINMIRELST